MGRLSELAVTCKTDKWGHHYYTEHYERELLPYIRLLASKNIIPVLMEIGIGGYEYPDRGGASLNMWYLWLREIVSDSKIVGVDLYDKSKINLLSNKIIIERAAQEGKEIIDLANTHKPQIIIDDASHINDLTIKTFTNLFPVLPSGGVYIIEDTQTSYWHDGEYKGAKTSLNISAPTSVNFFKILVDHLNGFPHHIQISSVTDSIAAIHFKEEMIFIWKK